MYLAMTSIHFLHSIVDQIPLLFGVLLKHREMATGGTAGQVCDTGREVGHGSRLTSEVHLFFSS